MKALTILAAAVVCISGCRPADQDHVSRGNVRPQREHTRPIARAELFASSTSTTAHSRNLAGVPHADLAAVRDRIDEDALDPRTFTPDELRLWAVRRLGLTALSLDRIPSDGPLTESEAASLLLNRTANVTSNVIERLAALSPSAVERITEEVRNLRAIAAGDYVYFTDDRLVMLYQYLARPDKPTDVRLEALCGLSQHVNDSEDRMRVLSHAVEIARADEGARQYFAPFSVLAMHYKEQGNYRDAIEVCDQMLIRLQAQPEVPHATSIRGKFLEDKILCLSALGRSAEALDLLRDAQTRTDLSPQFRHIFNSREFEEEVRAYGHVK